MKRSRTYTMFILLFLAFLFSEVLSTAGAQDAPWQAPPEEAQMINPVKADNGSIMRGKELFIKYCSTCHGVEGMGDGPVASRLITEPPDLTAIAGKQTDGGLAWKIATGRNPMPSWKDKLSDKEIWDVVNFIRSLKPMPN